MRHQLAYWDMMAWGAPVGAGASVSQDWRICFIGEEPAMGKPCRSGRFFAGSGFEHTASHSVLLVRSFLIA